MRLLTVIAALAAAAAAALAAGAAPAQSGTTGPPVFVLSGGGWGHAVGMSQWGALGQVQAGRTYRDVLGHYYPGTAIGTTQIERVRVLVATGRTLQLTLDRPGKVFDAAGRPRALAAGPHALTPDLQLAAGKAGAPVRLQGPVTVEPAAGSVLALGGKRYRGALRFVVERGSLLAVNVVSLEEYLLGVVPVEMPKDWPVEALKAQAVAARTYALAGLVQARPFDLYSDWRSQAYYGADSEAPNGTAAVEATRGEIVTWKGAPARTFFSASSGGRTAAAVDLWGEDVPYLRSVEDPWDSVSPFHRWPARVFSGAELGRAFGLASAVVDAAVVPGAPGRPAVLRLTSRSGAVTTARLMDARQRLGLRSTSFRLGVLALGRPAAGVVAGQPLELRGVARLVDAPTLERRQGGRWAQVSRITPSADGTFTVVVRPEATTSYRITAAGLSSPAALVKVAPGTTP